jgi:hypothetical protein
MVGRPRKIGKRERNGRIARVYENPKAQVAAQPHRLDVLSKYREWPEAESEFGRLMLNGRITPAQYQAGRLYAGLADSYRAVWDMPRIHPAGIDLTRVGVSQGREMASDHARSVKRRYELAFEACMEAGHRAQRAVKDHAIFERKISDFGTIDQLKAGLDKLVVHFGIDPKLQISSSRQ